MTRSAGEYHIFASMSGMLDLSRDEKAKHFLPRWLRDVQYQCRAEMIVTMSTSCQSRRCAIRGSGMGAMLRPRRRAVDRAAMRPDGYHVGELAFRRKVAWDVRVVCRRPLKMVGDGFAWIEYKHGFLELAAESVNRSRLIGIACYQSKAVSVRPHGIDKGGYRKVYVGAFLFKFHDVCHPGKGFFASLAFPVDMGKPCFLLAVEPFDDFHPTKCGECLEVDFLAFFGDYVMRVCADAGREILDGEDFMFLLEHGGGKCAKIEPFAAWRALQQTVVEIVAVYVNKCLFHCFEMQGASTFRSKPLRRIGRASRVEYNPLMGSAHIVSNRVARNKGVKFGVINLRSDARRNTAVITRFAMLRK